MKNVVVTLELKVQEDASIEEVMNEINIDTYKCVEEVVSVKGEVVEDDSPSDLCIM